MCPASVLGLHAGGRIVLDDTAFVRPADACFIEIEKRFVG